jgi:2-polyprenyl-3-methyl-5-hydroxy-6-metoxy-1,4-benzoquinol methylase
VASCTIAPHPDFGFLRVQPTPSEAEIERFYAEEFYSGDYKRFNDSSLEAQTEDRVWLDARRADVVADSVRLFGRKCEELTLLDVGCGWGQALLYFRGQGMRCAGFDPVPEAVAYATRRGLDVRVAGFGNMNVFERSFDVITLFNVLEHLARPEVVLAQLHDLLVPGGLLFVDVPNEYNAFQTAGRELHSLREWWVCPPGHLNYFSPETLGRVVAGAHFEVLAAEASFPLEMFLLFGDDYTSDPALGKACHRKRVAFELNLRRLGKTEVLRAFYRSLAAQNLGRQVMITARRPVASR